LVIDVAPSETYQRSLKLLEVSFVMLSSHWPPAAPVKVEAQAIPTEGDTVAEIAESDRGNAGLIP